MRGWPRTGQGKDQMIIMPRSFLVYFGFLLSTVVVFCNAMQTPARSSLQTREFKSQVLKIGPQLQTFKPELMSEPEALSKSLAIFQPAFASLASQFPDPIKEAEALILAYVEALKTLPPDELFQPVREEAMRRQEKVFLCKLSIFLGKQRDILQALNDNENIGQMRQIVGEFGNDVEARKADVDMLFPEYEDVDQALLSGIKGVLLSRTTLENGIKSLRPRIPELFKLESERKDIFESASKLYGYFYAYNHIIRMMEQARQSKVNNKEILAQIYHFASSQLMVETLHRNFPVEIFRKFSQIKFKSEKERSYVKWRLANYNMKRQLELCPPGYKFVAEYLIMHELIMTQVMQSLEKFIEPEAIASTQSSKQLFPIWTEFHDKFFATTLLESTTSSTALKIFTNRMDRIVPETIKKNQKYRLFANLSQDDVAKILAPTVEQLEVTKKEPAFVDFLVEKGAKKKKRRAQLPAKVFNATRNAPVEKIAEAFEVPSALNEIKDSPDGTLAKNTLNKDSSVQDTPVEDSPAKDSLVKESSAKGSLAKDTKESSEETKTSSEDQEPQVIPDETKDEDYYIQEEVDQLMKEQAAEIQRYKTLKKQSLDLAKSQHSKVKVVNDSKASPKTIRMVAFLHTEDFRLINQQANELYLQNMVEDAARVNINGGSGRFKWVFDPSIVIDFDSYKFLCQLFSVVEGKTSLTYDNFLSTFSKLNPNKGANLTKRSKALNRTVFQFDHAFEADGVIYVPPIGGAHREHLSSRFNHIQIRKFLMHGGFHPYFFLKL